MNNLNIRVIRTLFVLFQNLHTFISITMSYSIQQFSKKGVDLTNTLLLIKVN